MYHVSTPQDRHKADTRVQAVSLAKDLSAQTHHEIIVHDDSGRETLTFRHGKLEVYTYDTHAKGPRF